MNRTRVKEMKQKLINGNVLWYTNLIFSKQWHFWYDEVNQDVMVKSLTGNDTPIRMGMHSEFYDFIKDNQYQDLDNNSVFAIIEELVYSVPGEALIVAIPRHGTRGKLINVIPVNNGLHTLTEASSFIEESKESMAEIIDNSEYSFVVPDLQPVSTTLQLSTVCNEREVETVMMILDLENDDVCLLPKTKLATLIYVGNDFNDRNSILLRDEAGLIVKAGIGKERNAIFKDIDPGAYITFQYTTLMSRTQEEFKYLSDAKVVSVSDTSNGDILVLYKS